MHAIAARNPTVQDSRRGAAVVEFAAVAPLFLLLLAGIIEFGQAFRIEHSLSNAARRGARAAITEGATSSQIVEKVKTHFAQTTGVSTADVSVSVAVNGVINASLAQAEEGDAISVTASIPYSRACAGFFANTFARSTLRATCTLERE